MKILRSLLSWLQLLFMEFDSFLILKIGVEILFV